MGEKIFCLGVMSGTSLDGVDIVYAVFNPKRYSEFEIVYSRTIPYASSWKNILQKAITYNDLELEELSVAYAQLLGTMLQDFIHSYHITKIDFIASHGHTIKHQPKLGYTLQIGDGQTIANKTKIPVVCDFRSQDVALGGEGAPLVPIGDKLLFSEFDRCVNLGGFANISFENKQKDRIAFDICPVNIVLNHYVQDLGFDFDDGGQIAAKGVLNHQLLEHLNRLDFYQKAPPKSLGLEWVQDIVFPLIETNNFSIPSILRTFTEHAAIQIASHIKESKHVLFTGGGVFNSFLIQRIAYHTKKQLVLPNKELIEYKEALVFAFLGLLRMQNQTNCLASVTGASKDHCSGVIFYPQE
ncbi:anhydro-N-acetylmuramic acid kinase [Tenacibaculum sp. SG-28]|uniref:anhydro-N-acetylmuramic acid kinase n=1 Tax=Tenacibaculum sp. SG-28 TaxID=754426 RepID=UPI000CF48AFE|nr:anhydro-N-acetylmuramic acid kinase [Tenacibaculum sp. SG-28]PQJ19609.1 anhydro-N-acetylmuramic acid kinase [Tenacibaculum sp. SG-28]